MTRRPKHTARRGTCAPEKAPAQGWGHPATLTSPAVGTGPAGYQPGLTTWWTALLPLWDLPQTPAWLPPSLLQASAQRSLSCTRPALSSPSRCVFLLSTHYHLTYIFCLFCVSRLSCQDFIRTKTFVACSLLCPQCLEQLLI